MRRLNVVPVPVRIKLTRTSFNVLASWTNLSYFSYATGTKSMNAERSIPAMEMKIAKPERPAKRDESAAPQQHRLAWRGWVWIWPLTWANAILCLEGCDTGVTCHGEEVEKDLARMGDNGWL